jgi:proteasome lid subunit RPN8/RPN11
MVTPKPEPSADDFVVQPKRRRLAKDDPADLPAFVLDDTSQFILYIADHVVTGLRQYCNLFQNTEVGGVMYGRHFKRGSQIMVDIDDYRPLPSKDASSAHFTFDEQSLATLHNLQIAADRYFVGWFHSHPHLGDPFMSQADIELHMRHCREPWYISAVVAVGELALPIGFYRMEDRKLINVTEHFLHMTSAVSAGEQTRRYFKACIPEKSSASDLVSDLPPLIHNLGLPTDGHLAKLITSQEPADQNADANSPSPLLLLFRTARRISQDADCLDELRDLEIRMEPVKFFEDTAELIAASDFLAEKIAVYRHVCVSHKLGTPKLQCLDFVKNVVWPLSFREERPLENLAISDNGTLWIVRARGEVLLVRNFERSPAFDSPKPTGPIWFDVCRLPLTARAHSVLGLADSILIASGNTVYHVSAASAERTPPYLAKWHIDVAMPYFLVRDRSDEALVVNKLGNRFHIGSLTGDAKAFSLPAPWQKWDLAGGSSCSAGLLMLFDDRGAGQLGLFDLQSGTLVRHYLERKLAANRSTTIASIASDARGRAFVNRGTAVFLLPETGAADPSWYCARSLAEKPFLKTWFVI